MDELNHRGVGFERVAFVVDAALRIAAAMRAADTPGSGIDRDKMARQAFDDAETLWGKLCERYPDDAEEDEE